MTYTKAKPIGYKDKIWSVATLDHNTNEEERAYPASFGFGPSFAPLRSNSAFQLPM